MARAEITLIVVILAQNFMSIIKHLPNKQEVIEYMQAFLGNGPAALTFTKFFVTKKLALFGKTKQMAAAAAHAAGAEVNTSLRTR